MIGAAGKVQAGPPLVVLLVNMEVIRTHPLGAKMGPLFSGIPQWDEFMDGTNVDPVRDTDWLLITGPSLLHTERDAIIIHYSASDAVVDKAIEVVSHKYHLGGPMDAGVAGVKATLGHADRAPRVFLRPQPHVLAVVPTDYAHTAAKLLIRSRVNPHVRAGEAMRLTLQHPHGPMPFLPDSITELRMWIVPRKDGGADVSIDGQCANSQKAEEAALLVRRVIQQQNTLAVRLVTHGILDGVKVDSDGSTVRLRAVATREHLQAIYDLVAAELGVNVAPQEPQENAP